MIFFLKELLLPPGIFLLAGLFGIWDIRNNPRRARRILITVAILFYIFSTKVMASLLMGNLPVPAPLPPLSLGIDENSAPPRPSSFSGPGSMKPPRNTAAIRSRVVRLPASAMAPTSTGAAGCPFWSAAAARKTPN